MSAHDLTAAPVGVRDSAERIAAAWPRLGATLVVAGTAWLAADKGGYWPTSWGWSALGFVWVAGVSVVLRSDLRLERLEVATLGAFVALLGWVVLATAWTGSVTATMREAERLLVPIAGLGALLLVARRRSTETLLLGIAAATTAVAGWSLLTRLLPDRIGTFDPVAGYRLHGLVGYWNGLGLLAAIGLVLSLGLAARAASPVRQAAAAALAPILASTLYFTYSRGASLAAAIGLVVVVTLDRRRAQLVTAVAVALVPAAVAVSIASQLDALGSTTAPLAAAARDGHRYLAVVVAICIVAAAATFVRTYAEARLRMTPRAGRVYARSLAGAVAVAVLLSFVHWGSPATIARRGYRSFVSSAPAPASQGSELKRRLSTFSGSGRATLWHAAWTDARAHPLLGSGPGTYERWWLLHRPVALKVKDAHNLYLETLAEQGPLGLALLLLALGLPLAALARARRDPVAAIAAGAYFAFLVHAAVDWDWELSGVTLTALLCGGVVLVAGRSDSAVPPGPRARAATLTAAVAVGVLALGGLLGNLALSRSADAARNGHWSAAAASAGRAHTYAPWSSQPYRLEALAQSSAARARPLLLHAIARDRGDWQLWLELAWASRGAGRRDALAEATRLDPLSPEIADFRSRNR